MSYIKIWLHCVWSTKERECIIPYKIRPALLSHIRENAENKNIILDFINAHKDHVHALVCLGKQETVAQIMQTIKGESSHWVNKMELLPYHFGWQDDYFAVSVSPSHVDRVREYIKNQDEHHRRMTWDEEVDIFLKKFGFERGKG
jgi:putative transposase